MEHLVGGLQSQALGFRSLLSVKDVYLKRSTTRELSSVVLLRGFPGTQTHSQPRGVTRLTISEGDDDDGSLENSTAAISAR